MAPGLVPAWERRASGRYQYELDALVAVVGSTLHIDEEALATGLLVVDFDWRIGEKVIPLRVIFPDSFPRLRPLVYLRHPAMFLKRHCNPLDGNLCLLGRNTAQWREDWTLVDLLRNQLESALADTGEQDPQGEPAEVWWNILGLKNSYCLVDSNWTLNNAASGWLKLSFEFDTDAHYGFVVRGVVTEIRNEKGEVLQRWTSKVPVPTAFHKQSTAAWVYCDETLLPCDQNRMPDLVRKLLDLFPEKPRVEEFNGSISGRIFAVLHKIELSANQTGLGWIFLFEHGHPKAFRKPKPGKRARSPNVGFIPALRAGTTDIGARVPATAVLNGKKIAVFGVGAIGAPVAIDLARNGCSQLALLDLDTVEPGNSIRWSLGESSWGKQKAVALAEFIEGEYPWCSVIPKLHRVGTVAAATLGDESIISELLDGSHLVVDATAEYGVATILSDYCIGKNLPLISFYASPPVTGGAVTYFHPRSGCPTCLEFAHDAGMIPPAPGFNSAPALQQPPGCAELTFTGASYDLQELSLQAMRIIVNALTAPPEGSMVYVLALPGGPQPPSWTVHQLPKMDACSCNQT